MRLVSFVASLLLVFPAADMYCQSSGSDIVRKLEDYDKAGPYDLDTSDWAARARWQREIREFVWSHWRTKKLGYLQATYYTKEGDPTAVHLYIEPNKGGSWHVLLEENADILNRLTGQHRTEHKRYAVQKVVRSKAKSKGDSWIRLLDKEGTVVREF